MYKTRSFIKLFKFQLSYKLGLKRIKNSFSQLSHVNFSLMGSTLFVLFLATIILAPYSILMIQLYKEFNTQGNVIAFFETTFVLNNMILLFTSLLSVFSLMFSDKDREILVPLPIKKHHVFLCNFLVMYLSSILSSFIFIIPSAIIHFAFSGFSLLFLVKILLCILFFPALPLCFAYLIMSIVLRFVSNFRFKEVVAIIAGVLLVAAFFILGNNEKMMMSIVNKGREGVPLLNKILFNSYFFSSALSNDQEGILMLLCGVGISVVLLVAIYVYGGFSYDTICKKMKNTSSYSSDKNINYKHSNVENTFFKKEIKTILRSPIVALNCLLNIVIAPIAAYMIYDKKEIVNDLILKIFDKGGHSFVLFMIGLYAGLIIMSINMVPSTSISREGKFFWIIKTSPVLQMSQIKGRIKAAMFFYNICGFVYFILFGILLKLHFLYIIYGLAVLFLSSISFSICGIIVDFKNPKLYWDKESEAVKQNLNGMIGIFISIILSIIYIVPFAIYMIGTINKTITLILVPLICIISIFVLVKILKNTVRRKELYYEG